MARFTFNLARLELDLGSFAEARRLAERARLLAVRSGLALVAAAALWVGSEAELRVGAPLDAVRPQLIAAGAELAALGADRERVEVAVSEGRAPALGAARCSSSGGSLTA